MAWMLGWLRRQSYEPRPGQWSFWPDSHIYKYKILGVEMNLKNGLLGRQLLRGRDSRKQK
jgi:hypothetical protein